MSGREIEAVLISAERDQPNRALAYAAAAAARIVPHQKCVPARLIENRLHRLVSGHKRPALYVAVEPDYEHVGECLTWDDRIVGLSWRPGRNDVEHSLVRSFHLQPIAVWDRYPQGQSVGRRER